MTSTLISINKGRTIRSNFWDQQVDGPPICTATSHICVDFLLIQKTWQPFATSSLRNCLSEAHRVVDCCKGEVVNIISLCDLLHLSFINYEKSHLHSVCDVCSPPKHSWSKAAKLNNSFCASILREHKQSTNAHRVRSDWKYLL